MSSAPLVGRPPGILVEGQTITITDVRLTDPVVAGHFVSLDPEVWADEAAAALAVGVRGLTAMGTGSAAHRVSEAVERVVDDAFTRTEQRVGELLETGRREMGRTLDPEVRSSLTARLLSEMSAAHQELLDGIDPDRRDSHTARFVAELDGFLGRNGQLEQRICAALDPSAPDSALARVVAGFDEHFRELRDLIVASTARADEAARGTAKGFAFEDVVEARLRALARHIGGAMVERTSSSAGAAGSAALVGDLVVTLADGTRIVVEAKHTTRIGLNGRDGILEELDRAMANRTATWAICVSHDDAYPEEVGAFGIYGSRVLIVDDGTGDLIRVALRWIEAAARAAAAGGEGVDIIGLDAQIDRLRALATRFSRAKRNLSSVQSGIAAVRADLDELRAELLDGAAEMTDLIRRAQAEGAGIRVA